MKYRAVVLDLDGTTIPNRKDGSPSPRVVAAVRRVIDMGVSVSIATGRGIEECRSILRKLGIKAPCIVNGGTRVIDATTEQVLWEKELSQVQVESVLEVAKKYNSPVFFSDDKDSTMPDERIVKQGERIVYIQPVPREHTAPMLEQLGTVPGVVSHRLVSWTPDHYDIHVTHEEATKRHALEIVLEKIGVPKEEVVAIGDGHNDLPLFELAGYKVAMGNASNELKEKADLIAPSVEDDGVAGVLNNIFR